jgi:SsrA-binding protein
MADKKKKGASDNIVATNRKARHEYDIVEQYEAGLVLRGTEVKSLRNHQCSLVDSYASFKGGELFVHNIHIAPYEQGNRSNVDSKRSRKLLLHASELRKLVGAVTQKGFTLIPLQVYFKAQYAKVRLGLCRGKKAYDKRESIRRRDEARDMDREIKAGFASHGRFRGGRKEE